MFPRPPTAPHCNQPVKEAEEDPYPWIDEDDPCKHMTDEEILTKYIDLFKSDEEKEKLHGIILTHKKGHQPA